MIGFGVKSVLPSRLHISRMANSRIFCSYEFSPPQLLQNLQLRKPLASADSKDTLTPLDSALTDGLTLTPPESTLTKRGWGPQYWSHFHSPDPHRASSAGAIIQGASSPELTTE